MQTSFSLLNLLTIIQDKCLNLDVNLLVLFRITFTFYFFTFHNDFINGLYWICHWMCQSVRLMDLHVFIYQKMWFYYLTANNHNLYNLEMSCMLTYIVFFRFSYFKHTVDFFSVLLPSLFIYWKVYFDNNEGNDMKIQLHLICLRGNFFHRFFILLRSSFL